MLSDDDDTFGSRHNNNHQLCHKPRERIPNSGWIRLLSE